MGTINYTIPQAGTDLNSVADPEIATALATIRTWANGNVDTNNISPTAAITSAQLARGAGGLQLVTKSANYTATDAQLVLVTGGAPLTITLPTPVLNTRVGVEASAGFGSTVPITVTTPSGAIGGVGVFTASITLGAPGAFVMLHADGTNWNVVSGQQDTGWHALGLQAGFSQATGAYQPAQRLIGDRVFFKGAITTSGLATVGTTVATGTYSPSANYQSGPIGNVFTVSNGATALVVGISSWSAGTTTPLDGLSFTLS